MDENQEPTTAEEEDVEAHLLTGQEERNRTGQEERNRTGQEERSRTGQEEPDFEGHVLMERTGQESPELRRTGQE